MHICRVVVYLPHPSPPSTLSIQRVSELNRVQLMDWFMDCDCFVLICFTICKVSVIYKVISIFLLSFKSFKVCISISKSLIHSCEGEGLILCVTHTHVHTHVSTHTRIQLFPHHLCSTALLDAIVCDCEFTSEPPPLPFGLPIPSPTPRCL